MSTLEEIRSVRAEKLKKLEDFGMNPYPSEIARDLSLKEIKSQFEDKQKIGTELSIAGRIMAIRGQGGILFVSLNDGTGTFQSVVKKDEMDEKLFSLFEDAVDIGDFISVTGTTFTTKRGEESLLAKSWTMATKSLLPLPEKWAGLQDEEERLRKRYLDILTKPELKEIFEKKTLFWNTVRTFLKEKNFTEVETPTLEITTGGAEARPFKTHHNDFDMDVFLRISVGELWQKRLMAGGFERTFEIGKVYRNEGTSPEHLQEFTNMEFYAAYMTFEQGKKLIIELCREVANKTFGTTKFSVKGHTFDLDDEWKELDYVGTVKEMTGVEVLSATEDEMRNKLEELGVKYDGDNKERMTDSLWKYCRKQISGPAFLVNHPVLVAPLSTRHPDNPELTKTLQIILAGSEMGRAHAELNDPIEQTKRFEKQQELLKEGDNEAMMTDNEFVEMLEHGMPPTFGFGFGERLFSTLTGKPIRETQLFPLVKPK